LLKSATNGSLMAALAGGKSKGSEKSVDELRRQAREALLTSAFDGRLASVLAAGTPKASASLEEMRLQAQEALLKSASDGSLRTMLAAATQAAPCAPGIQELRLEARAALMKSATDGSLRAVLASGALKGPPQDSIVELRREASTALMRAAQDGSLLTLLSAGKAQTPALSEFKYQPSVGSWLLKKPPQVERPWYYRKIEAVSEDEKVFLEFQSVIAQKDAEIDHLKASLRLSSSGQLSLPTSPAKSQAPPPPPAARHEQPAAGEAKAAKSAPSKAAGTGDFRCLDASALQNLYSKFPPVQRPAKAPEVVQAAEFQLRPSVGTWLSGSPETQEEEPAVKAAPKAVAPEVRKPWNQCASVGSWLMLRPEEDFSERPGSVNILSRTHEQMFIMQPEELVLGFEKAIHRKDEEIHKLKEKLGAA